MLLDFIGMEQLDIVRVTKVLQWEVVILHPKGRTKQRILLMFMSFRLINSLVVLRSITMHQIVTQLVMMRRTAIEFILVVYQVVKFDRMEISCTDQTCTVCLTIKFGQSMIAKLVPSVCQISLLFAK